MNPILNDCGVLGPIIDCGVVTFDVVPQPRWNRVGIEPPRARAMKLVELGRIMPRRPERGLASVFRIDDAISQSTCLRCHVLAPTRTTVTDVSRR